MPLFNILADGIAVEYFITAKTEEKARSMVNKLLKGKLNRIEKSEKLKEKYQKKYNIRLNYW